MPIVYVHAVIAIIFTLVYLGMALGRFPGLALDRTGIAVLGAIAMIGIGGISLRDAARSLDFQTLLLLFGLMLFSVQLRHAGFYTAVGNALTHRIHSPRRLLLWIILVSAILSALLANDIVCLAFTPVLCSALLAARRDPIPYLVALATSSNIGSAATLIGNPQNMYIGEAGQLSFPHFAAVMFPVVCVSLFICWGIIILIWRKNFSNAPIELPIEEPRRSDAINTALDRALIIKTLAILAALVVAFLILPAGPRVVATLIAGGLLLISSRKDSARLYIDVDWNLLLLFCGLFVVNGTMQESGITAQMMRHVSRAGIDLHHPPTLAAVTTILSNIVSNVPAVLLLRPSIPQNNHQAWYLLALASTFAGNLTLVGSIANLIVAEQASRLGINLDLKSYCKAGIPITLITLVLGTAWLIWVMG